MRDIYEILKNINTNNNIINQKTMTHNIMFNITNLCNLNCTNCSLLCGDRTPFTIKFEDFKKQILHFSKFIPKIGSITLIGGEPFLHPYLLEMCEFIFNNIPHIMINIISNGTLCDKISDEELLKYKKYKVHFIFTIYPKKELINKIAAFEKRCEQNQIHFEIHGIRPCFGIPDFNQKGTNNKDQYFYRCEKSSSPHTFVIFDGKVYNCCLIPSYSDMGLPVNSQDFIPLENIQSFDELLNFANHPYEGCKYCQLQEPIGEPLHFWHTQDEVPSADPFKQMYELYLDDYDYYYQLCHTYGEIKECLQDKYFLSKQNITDHLTSKPIKQYQKRFFTGKMDVFIPFNDFNANELINLKPFLFNQINIENVNLYFVSDDASKETEKMIYFNFPPLNGGLNISIMFLKKHNYLNSFEAFFKNSFLNKIIILNTKKDYNSLKINNKYLEYKYLYDYLERIKLNKYFI